MSDNERKEPQCPFCMSTDYYDLPTKEVPYGPNVAWRGDLGPGLWMALKHKPTCPRFLGCMGCEKSGITGVWGMCWDCCAEDEKRREDDRQEGV